jgi:hypothetical protein
VSFVFIDVGSNNIHIKVVGGDSVLSIATRYGLDGPGIKSQWGRDFSDLCELALGLCAASCTMATGSLSQG